MDQRPLGPSALQSDVRCRLSLHLGEHELLLCFGFRLSMSLSPSLFVRFAASPRASEPASRRALGTMSVAGRAGANPLQSGCEPAGPLAGEPAAGVERGGDASLHNGTAAPIGGPNSFGLAVAGEPAAGVERGAGAAVERGAVAPVGGPNSFGLAVTGDVVEPREETWKLGGHRDRASRDRDSRAFAKTVVGLGGEEAFGLMCVSSGTACNCVDTWQ